MAKLNKLQLPQLVTVNNESAGVVYSPPQMVEITFTKKWDGNYNQYSFQGMKPGDKKTIPLFIAKWIETYNVIEKLEK